MKSLLIVLISFSIAINCFAQDTKTIANKILASTVSIITKDKNYQTLALGSGFITDSEEIVTNVHVVEGAKYVFVIKNKSNEEISSNGYISLDKENDIILLKVPGLTGNKLEIKQTAFPHIGEPIYVAGNPKGLSGTFSDGLVSGIRELEKRNLIQISAPISPGSSGGPVVDKSANIVGVSVGGISGGQNLNFAIPALYVKKLIENKSELKLLVHHKDAYF
ncbi:MAG: S1C family serine protease [Bacteroidales bacterium]|nr:S1C family serine protease [Bacteroidales bacterium]